MFERVVRQAAVAGQHVALGEQPHAWRRVVQVGRVLGQVVVERREVHAKALRVRAATWAPPPRSADVPAAKPDAPPSPESRRGRARRAVG
jgi:hypothetical protein